MKGLSIGFRALEYSILADTGGYKFERWQWLELSAVTIPANADCSITTLRSLDTQIRAALGTKTEKGKETSKPSGASENKKVQPVKISTAKEADKTMKIAEQIKTFQNERAAKDAKMEEIMKAASEAGATLDEAQSEEFDTLEREIEQIDKHLSRLDTLQKSQMRTAAPAEGDTRERAAGSRIGMPAVHAKKDHDEKFKGQNYTRMVIAKALAHIDENRRSPAVIAEKRWGITNPTLVEIMRANEVAGGGSGSGEWGAELVSADTRYTGDFIEYLNSMTVFDKLGLREVPANVAIKGQDGAATGYWIGESKAVKASTVDFSLVNLTPLKVAALAVVSNELLRNSSPRLKLSSATLWSKLLPSASTTRSSRTRRRAPAFPRPVS